MRSIFQTGVRLTLCAFLIVPSVAAQDWHGFVTGGVSTTDYGAGFSRGVEGQVSTGLLLQFGSSPISAGGQLDVRLSLPYATPRGGPLGEVALFRTPTVRPFVNGGYFAGEGGGLPVVGGGMEFLTGPRWGLRIFVQDFISRTRIFVAPNVIGHRTVHEPSFQVGLAWQ